jgi:hypothetical protein
MVGAIWNSLSYIVASPFMALWQMFGDKMGTHTRSLVEVEGLYFIFGGAVGLCQARGLAHVLGQDSTRALRPGAPSSLRKYCTNSEKRTTYPFVQDRVILPAATVRENIAGGRYKKP